MPWIHSALAAGYRSAAAGADGLSSPDGAGRCASAITHLAFSDWWQVDHTTPPQSEQRGHC